MGSGKRLLGYLLFGSLALGNISCESLKHEFKESKEPILNPYQEIFRTNSQKNKQSIREIPHLEVDYNNYDAKNNLVVINDRVYSKDNSRPKKALEKIINVEPQTRHKIPLINASYIEKPNDEIILNYKSRVPPSDLKKIIEPYLSDSDIKINEFPQKNTLVFSGKKENFGDFSYLSSILNQFDTPAEQIRVKMAILEFFGDNTYNRDAMIKMLKRENIIFDLNLPSSSEGGALEYGLGANPLYHIKEGHYDFDSLVKFLDSKGYAEILSNIDLLSYNGKTVEMSNTSSIPYPEIIFEEGTLVETLKYRDTGIQLNLTPYKNEEGYITLKIEKAESGEQTGYAGKEQRPTFRTANLSSEYTFQNGETYIALGSTFSRYKEVERGIPLLNKIPVLKELVTSKSYENNRSHLIYLMEARSISREDLTGRVPK